MNVIKIILPPKQGTNYKLKLALLQIHLTKFRKIWDGHTQRAARFYDPLPFTEHPINISSLEVLQHMAVVYQVNAISLNKGQIVNCCDVIHVRVINSINMHETRYKAFPTTQM